MRSPESLVSVKNGEVVTNPIAGTRPRGANEAEDAALADEPHMMSKKLRNTVCWLTWDVMILVRLLKWYGQGDQAYGG